MTSKATHRQLLLLLASLSICALAACPKRTTVAPRPTDPNRPVAPRPPRHVLNLPVPQLLKSLQNPDLRTRALAAIALGERGIKKAVPLLIEHLVKDSSRDVRLAAGMALGLIGGARASAALLALMESRDLALQAVAASAVKRWIDREPKTVIAAMSSPSTRVRMHAALALSQAKHPKAVDWLAVVLRTDPSPVVRATAAFGLGKRHDPKSLPVLIAALADKNDSVAKMARTGLRAYGDEATRTCLVLLNHPDEGMRKGAARGLALAGPSVVPDLMKRLSSASPSERVAASAALMQLGSPAEDALLKLLENPIPPRANPRAVAGDQRARAAAVAVLVTGRVERAGPALLKILTAPRSAPESRILAANGLVQMGYKPAQAAFIKLLASKQAKLRTLAVIALGRMGDKAAWRPLSKRARDSDPAVRLALTVAIVSLGKRLSKNRRTRYYYPKLTRRVVRRLARDRNRKVRKAANTAMRRMR